MNVRRTLWIRLVVWTSVLCLPACAARLAVPPVGTPPQYPELVYPEVPSELQQPQLLVEHDAAWRWLQAAEPRNAERGFAAVLKRQPTFYPAETGLGLVELTSHRYDAALRYFDAALARSPLYVPALVGRGEAQLALNRDQDALNSFEAAVAVDPSLALTKSRIEVLQFRLLQANLSAARSAAAAGRTDDAIRAYQEAIAASPESAFLYRELGATERRSGNLDSAFEHYSKATELEPTDSSAWRGLAEILEARSENTAAIEAYRRAAILEPDTDVQDRIARLEAGMALARLPAEYRAIPEAPAITRGDLAALVGVRFDKLLEDAGSSDSVLVTDTRDHWAAPWIFAVTRAGVLDVYPNHTFQPDAIVRRGDLAESVNHLLTLISQRIPGLTEKLKTSQREIADVAPGHLSYEAVSAAVASGVLPLLEGDTFQLSRPVTGAEAVAAMDRLERLIQ